MADVDMEDMEIDLGIDDPEIARLHAETAAMDAQAERERAQAGPDVDVMTGVEEPPEEGEVDGTELAPTKVYIRGLDNFNPNDLKAYVAEHGVSDLFKNVQWIDDASANLVFDTPRAAEDALQALSVNEEMDPRMLRLAKRLSTRPDAELEIRQATISDVKINNASLYSKFYLHNPEYDPETRAANRKRRRDQDHRGDRGGRSKHTRSDRWEYRDPSPNATPFDENLYDDEPKAVKRTRRTSTDLFAGKDVGRLRGRSASPFHDGDGRYGFEESGPARKTARYRSRTPPNIRSRKEANHAVKDTLRKELFPEKASLGSSVLSQNANMRMNDRAQTASPTRHATPNKLTKELFPEKLTPTHRRREARDIHPNEVATAIGKFILNDKNGRDAQAYGGHVGRRPENSDRRRRTGDEDLFPHLENAGRAKKDFGRLNGSDVGEDHQIAGAGASGGGVSGGGEYSFKGQNRGEAGFSILGASKAREEHPMVKELFPSKVRTNGADLFDGRIKGRAARRRAEDLM